MNTKEQIPDHIKKHMQDVGAWLNQNVLVYKNVKSVTLINFEMDWHRHYGTFQVQFNDDVCPMEFSISIGGKGNGTSSMQMPIFHSPLGAPASYCAIEITDEVRAAIENALNDMYRAGEGVPRDYKKAAYWYQRGADLGNAQAQNNLGLLYKNGQEVKADSAFAAVLFYKAAIQGHAEAQANLAALHENADGIPYNLSQAAFWYQEAAKRGLVKAQIKIADFLAEGKGIQKNTTDAAHWYKRAAEDDDIYAQNKLGVLYTNGDGVKQDYKRAKEWFLRSAEQGRLRHFQLHLPDPLQVLLQNSDG